MDARARAAAVARKLLVQQEGHLQRGQGALARQVRAAHDQVAAREGGELLGESGRPVCAVEMVGGLAEARDLFGRHARAGREHERVEPQRAAGLEGDGPRGRVDADAALHIEAHAQMKQRSQGAAEHLRPSHAEGNVRQERLADVVVVAVEQHDLEPRGAAREAVGGDDAPDAATHDHHALRHDRSREGDSRRAHCRSSPARRWRATP